MNAIVSLFGAFLQSTSFTLDKAALRIRNIDWQTYTSISFPLLVVFDALFFIIVHPTVNWTLLGGTGGLFVLVTIAIGFITNTLYYRALDEDYLQEIQTWGVFIGIPTLVINSIIFTDERRLIVLIPAFIATAAATWAHLDKKNRLAIRPKTALFIGFMVLAVPALAAMNKIILQTWNPILLELVRDSSLALVFWLFVSRGIRHVSARAWAFLLLTNIYSSAAWIIYYYSYQHFGVAYTILLFAIQPILVYIFSMLFLREPYMPRKIIAFFIILASIIAAQVLK